jgi:hypothetical protein
MIDHERTQRPADRAGETAEQREVCDRTPRVAAVDAAERGEHRVIEPGAHADADHRPCQQVDRQVRRQGGADETGGIEQRTRKQNRPAAVTVDDGADLRRNQPADQQADRGAADHKAERPTGIGNDGRGKNRRKIERRAPGQNLADAECRYNKATVDP